MPRLAATLLHRLYENAQSHPDRKAITFLDDRGGGRSLTYAELLIRAGHIAGHLVGQSEPQSRALLLYETADEFASAFLGCLQAGIIAVPSYPPRREASVQHVLGVARDAGASLVLTTTAACETHNLKSCFHDVPVVCTDAIERSANVAAPRDSQSEIAFLQYTSGSTGSPRGVVVSQANLVANIKTIQSAFRLDENTVGVNWLPLFHDMGLVGTLLSPLFLGGHSVLLASESFLRKPVRWLRAISEYRGTCCGGPNFAYDLCLDRFRDCDSVGLDLTSWQVAFTGAEPIRATTLERFAEKFGPHGFRRTSFFPCYGLAETTLFASGGPYGTTPTVLRLECDDLEQGIALAVPEGDGVRDVVACGPAGDGVTLRVVDPQTRQICSENVVGEVWISGPSVSSGYWNKPDESAETFAAMTDDDEGPFLRTGDLGFLRDGLLYVTGRLKDLIILHGRNIYPQDVERLAERSFDVPQPGGCAAFSLSLGDGERLCLVVEGNLAIRHAVRDANKRHANSTNGNGSESKIAVPEIDALVQAVRREVFDELEVSVDLIAVTQPAAFPRTTSGKVRRRECRRLVEHGPFDCLYYWTAPALRGFKPRVK